MKTPKFPGRAMERFLEAPLPDAVFQIAPRALTGIRINPRERSVGGRFVAALPDGAVRPAFEGTNIADPAPLEAKLREGMLKLGLSQGTIAVLVPELCVRIYLLPLDSSPASDKERDGIVRWRVGKLMPLLPDDARIVHQSVAVGNGERIVAAVARPEVVREYEGLFVRSGLVPGNVTLPSLSLLGLLPGGGGDALLVNVEDDSLSIIAVVGGEPALLRQKPFALERGAGTPAPSGPPHQGDREHGPFPGGQGKEARRRRLAPGAVRQRRRDRRRAGEAVVPSRPGNGQSRPRRCGGP